MNPAYYIQGLNTTSAHAHGAMFGVYGMLGIGLILFMLRSMYHVQKWNDKLIGFAFWSINIGLMLMLLLSLLSMGILQAIASVKKGMWYARSAEFLNEPGMDTIKWLRVFGDTIFAIGLFAFVWFIFSLKRKQHLLDHDKTDEEIPE